MSNHFEYSESESRTFGFDVFRAKIQDWDKVWLMEQLQHHQPDLVISRIDAVLQPRLFHMQAIMPHSLLADTLVYYGRSVPDMPAPALPYGVEIRKAIPEDQEDLKGLIAQIFTGYTNHYHSNPLFSGVDLAQGYMEWSLPYLADSDKLCFFIYQDQVLAGFLTARLYSDQNFADIILNGVLPRFEGQGKYGMLLRHLAAELRERQIAKMVVSTQLINQRVQQVWTREGLSLQQSFYTFHHFISKKAISALQTAI